MDPARRWQVDPGGPEDEIATVIGIDPKALGMFPCRPRWLGQALCARWNEASNPRLPLRSAQSLQSAG